MAIRLRNYSPHLLHPVLLTASREELEEIVAWLTSPDHAGDYHIGQRGRHTRHRRLRFSDPQTAFSCKLRWSGVFKEII